MARVGRMRHSSSHTAPRRLALCCLLACLVAMPLLSGCFPTGGPCTNPSLGPRPTATPNPGPGLAADGETPQQAAVRLFAVAQKTALRWGVSNRRQRLLFEASKPGEPVPICVEYGSTLAQWVLPNEVETVTGDMFAAMWPLAMEKDCFWVPMIVDGEIINEYGIHLDKQGRWVTTTDGWIGPTPGGLTRALQLASETLTGVLGPGTEVRPVVFVPSGNVFAVGDHDGRQAAMLIDWVRSGPGIRDIRYLHGSPDVGVVYTPAKLKRLFAAEAVD